MTNIRTEKKVNNKIIVENLLIYNSDICIVPSLTSASPKPLLEHKLI